jgi:hypothetical protein
MYFRSTICGTVAVQTSVNVQYLESKKRKGQRSALCVMTCALSMSRCWQNVRARNLSMQSHLRCEGARCSATDTLWWSLQRERCVTGPTRARRLHTSDRYKATLFVGSRYTNLQVVCVCQMAAAAAGLSISNSSRASNSATVLLRAMVMAAIVCCGAAFR